jgi:UDP-glucose 4-epimerase
VLHVLGIIERALGRPLHIVHQGRVHGDVDHTHADTRRAAAELGWRAGVRVEDGIPSEVAWLRQLYGS